MPDAGGRFDEPVVVRYRKASPAHRPGHDCALVVKRVNLSSGWGLLRAKSHGCPSAMTITACPDSAGGVSDFDTERAPTTSLSSGCTAMARARWACRIKCSGAQWRGPG